MHVHEGGQAIVGNVETGGGAPKCKDQVHEQTRCRPGKAFASALSSFRRSVPPFSKQKPRPSASAFYQKRQRDGKSPYIRRASWTWRARATLSGQDEQT